MVDVETGEVIERTLEHEGEAVREFYDALPKPVLVGLEATGSMFWFLLLKSLKSCRGEWPGRADPFEIRVSLPSIFEAWEF